MDQERQRTRVFSAEQTMLHSWWEEEGKLRKRRRSCLKTIDRCFSWLRFEIMHCDTNWVWGLPWLKRTLYLRIVLRLNSALQLQLFRVSEGPRWLLFTATTRNLTAWGSPKWLRIFTGSTLTMSGQMYLNDFVYSYIETRKLSLNI